MARLRSLLVASSVVFAVATAVGVSAASADYAYTVRPVQRFAFAARSRDAIVIPTPSQCVATYGATCYTPALIRSAYDVPSSLSGAGETIVVVDAYGSPTIRNDLSMFDQEFDLPDPTLNIVYPGGAPPFNPKQPVESSWAFETSLDVEWAHAIAPSATIDLVIAPSQQGSVVDAAEAYAVSHHLGQVMSLSYGYPEAMIGGNGNRFQQAQAHQVYVAAAQAGISVFAAAGDSGAGNGFATPNGLFPASDPLVTGVGGTDLFMTAAGAYTDETVWNDADDCPFGCTGGAIGATGGAPSFLFPAPAWQVGLTGQQARTVADVAYNASDYTGILIYASFAGIIDGPGFYFTGGTSEGAPQWAGIAALADQAAGHPLGDLNPALYAIGANPTEYAADFHDITVGDDAFLGLGFSAGPGYDMPTGLGSPDVANLISTLAGGG